MVLLVYYNLLEFYVTRWPGSRIDRLIQANLTGPINFYKAGDKEIREIRKDEGGHVTLREERIVHRVARSSWYLIALPYREILPDAGSDYAASGAAFDDAPTDRWILWFPEKPEVSRVLSFQLPLSIYRRTLVVVCIAKGTLDEVADLFRDYLPRVPLAPNWNWPLHPINSLRRDFVQFAGKSPVSRLRSFLVVDDLAWPFETRGQWQTAGHTYRYERSNHFKIWIMVLRYNGNYWIEEFIMNLTVPESRFF